MCWGVSCSNCPKFTQICPFLIQNTRMYCFLNYTEFITLGTKHFLKKFLRSLKVLKKALKCYCPFLLVAFTCLKATEPLREDNLRLPISPQEFLYSFN